MAVRTHKGRDEERLDLVHEGVPQTSRAQVKSCDEQGGVNDKQTDVEEEEDQSDGFKPLRLKGDWR